MELKWINEVFDANLGYMYMYHKRCRPNDISIKCTSIEGEA